jgi:hypothetical protein
MISASSSSVFRRSGTDRLGDLILFAGHEPLANSGKTRPLKTERDFYRGASQSAQSFRNQLSLFYSAPCLATTPRLKHRKANSATDNRPKGKVGLPKLVGRRGHVLEPS